MLKLPNQTNYAMRMVKAKYLVPAVIFVACSAFGIYALRSDTPVSRKTLDSFQLMQDKAKPSIDTLKGYELKAGMRVMVEYRGGKSENKTYIGVALLSEPGSDTCFLGVALADENDSLRLNMPWKKKLELGLLTVKLTQYGRCRIKSMDINTVPFYNKMVSASIVESSLGGIVKDGFRSLKPGMRMKIDAFDASYEGRYLSASNYKGELYLILEGKDGIFPVPISTVNTVVLQHRKR